MSMQLNPSEISELIKTRIKDFESVAETRNEGTVVSLTDGITRIHGLADAMQGEMLEFPGGVFGVALNLEQDSVGAVILGDYEQLDRFRRMAADMLLSSPVNRAYDLEKEDPAPRISPGCLGRVISATLAYSSLTAHRLLQAICPFLLNSTGP